MNVLIVDDHFLLLDGLEVLLSTLDFVQEIHRAADPETLQQQIAGNRFDVVLLDIGLGRYDGRELIGMIRERQGPVKILVLTSYEDSPTVKSALRAGFDGYLLKTDGREAIKQALLAAADGEGYISPRVKDIFFQAETSGPQPQLTAREREVLHLIVQEKTTREIAAALFIAEKTVETHRTNLLLKLDVKNIAGLVRKAIVTGLVKI